jgi:hypothetical protein
MLVYRLGGRQCKSKALFNMSNRPLPKLPNRKKQPKKQSKNKAPRISTRPADSARISECALLYGKALRDPINGPLACIPREPIFHSRSQRYSARGTFAVGTQGYGFAAARPCAINNAVASTQTSIFYSVAGYTGNVIDLQAIGSQVLTGEYNSPYIAASFSGAVMGGLQWRTVAHGLRVRYIGNRDNTNGQMILAYPPDHQTPNGLSWDQVLAVDDADIRTQPITSQWTETYFVPKYDSELDYSWGFAGGNYDTVRLDNVFSFCYVRGTTGDTYEFETYEILEMTGQAISGALNAVDPVGIQAAIGSAQKARLTKKKNNSTSSVLSGMAQWVTDNVSSFTSLATAGVSVISSVAKAL